MDNLTLIQTFAENITAKPPLFQYNSELRIEPASGSLQLVTATGGIVAVSQSTDGRAKVAVRHHSAYWTTVHQVMLKTGFLPVGKARMPGFLEYQNVAIPKDYKVQFTDGLDMLQTWWSYKVPGKAQPLMSMLILHREHWYPVQDLTCEQGTVLIHTLGDILKLYPLDSIVWLQQERPPQPPTSALAPSEPASDVLETDTESREAPPVPPIDSKKIGSYLVDAALLSAAQVELILCDQQETGMRFGEILVKRGWLKEQTIEFLMHNLILPQRAAARRIAASAAQRLRQHLEQERQAPEGLQPSVPNLGSNIHNRETLVTQDCLDTVDVIPNASTDVTSIHNRETLITSQASTLKPFELMPRSLGKQERQALASSGSEPDNQH